MNRRRPSASGCWLRLSQGAASRSVEVDSGLLVVGERAHLPQRHVGRRQLSQVDEELRGVAKGEAFALQTTNFLTTGLIDTHIAAAGGATGDAGPMLRAREEFEVEASIAKVLGSEVVDSAPLQRGSSASQFRNA